MIVRGIIVSLVDSLMVVCLSILLCLLSSFSPLRATDYQPAGTLVIDSVFLQSIQSSWQHIEKSFLILDSVWSPSTWQEFSYQKNDAFKPVDQNAIPLHLKKKLWLKTRVVNRSQVSLDLAFSVKSSKADVFIFDQGKTEHKAAGDFYPKSLWDSEENFLNVPDPYIVTLQLNPDEIKDLAIKLGPYVKNKEATIRLASYEFAYTDLSSWYSMRNLIQGLCLGMLLIMLFFNLLTYFASGRDHIYLLNSLYIFCLTFWFFETFELDKLTFLAEYPLLTELIRIPVGYGIGAFYLLFSQAMIGKRNIPSHLNKAIRYFLYLLIFGFSLSNLMVWLFYEYNLFNIRTILLEAEI